MDTGRHNIDEPWDSPIQHNSHKGGCICVLGQEPIDAMRNEFVQKVSRVNTDIDTVIRYLQNLKIDTKRQEQFGAKPFTSLLEIEEMNIDRGQYRDVIRISVRGGDSN
jgi:hypothetical protein